MLAIRMQRTGRKGHALFRVIVQDSRQSPTSGKVVAMLGSYDPHSKTTTIVKDKASFYLEHGAQPSPRVAKLLQDQGVTLPKWVKVDTSKSGNLKNPDKLRKNRPAEPTEPAAPTEAETEETASVEQTDETPPVEEKDKSESAESDAQSDSTPADSAE
jgi:small subunit ribosomal protein S16